MRHLFVIIFVTLLAPAFSQVAPRPDPPKLYNNLSNEFPQFLSASEAQTIEQKLENFSNETSNQICVVIVDDLGGLEAAEYATALINQWGIGQKDKNNGIVILIKPTGGAGGRDLFIAIGYGLEGAIPDLATKRIREEEMYPYLKSGQNFAAIDNAVTKLTQLAKKEIDVKNYAKKEKDVSWFTVIIIIFVIFIIISKFSRRGGYTYSGRGRHWGGGGWGGGGWSSGGGGGFGGFGGGSSGGGGSGGKW